LALVGVEWVVEEWERPFPSSVALPKWAHHGVVVLLVMRQAQRPFAVPSLPAAPITPVSDGGQNGRLSAKYCPLQRRVQANFHPLLPALALWERMQPVGPRLWQSLLLLEQQQA
jgi:hypothetical protein